MIRTQLYLPEDMYHQAKLLAQLDGVSISEYMREGLLMKIMQKNKQPPRGKKDKKKHGPLDHLVGKFGKKNGKKTNVAMTHNDIYDL